MRQKAGDKGFILISAIWIAGLFAVIATAFAIDVRVRLLAAANTAHIAKAEAIADGIVTLAAWKLTTEREGGRSILRNGEAWTCSWPGTSRIQIAVQDQGGLIDLNAASSTLLSRIFESIGLPVEEAGKIASAIEDYRDSDSDSQAGGSEPETYAGSTFGPKNGPFQAVEEISQLPGIDKTTYRLLFPIFTVHSLQPGVDPQFVPPSLKQRLGIKDKDNVPSALTPFVAPSQGTTFGIDVEAVLDNGTVFHRRAIIAVLNQPDRPFTVLAWQRAADAGLIDTRQIQTKPCFS